MRPGHPTRIEWDGPTCNSEMTELFVRGTYFTSIIFFRKVCSPALSW